MVLGSSPVAVTPELTSSFCHAYSNLKRACCVERALNGIFLITFERRGKILTGLKSNLSVRSFFLWTGTIFDSLRESGNLPDKIASLTQEVKYSKVNPLSFKILIGISPAVALFEGNPSITSFTVWTLTGWKENFAWLLTSYLILIKLEWLWNLFKMFWSASVFLVSVWMDQENKSSESVTESSYFHLFSHPLRAYLKNTAYTYPKKVLS